jgi:hypothetical protein
MAFIVCHIIAYVQILSAGFNLWGVDPRILINMPFGRNTVLVGMFMLVQLLGLVGAILIIQKRRLGYRLSIVHHVMLAPALVITGWGLVVMMDDRINLTLLFMSKPTGADVSFFWSLGWNTVFQQVTRNVPTGSTYIGVNLCAYACATVLWVGMDQTDEAKAEREMQVRRRQTRRRPSEPLALPYYPPDHHYPPPPQRPARTAQQTLQQYLQEQRLRPPQGARQPGRAPRDW